MDDKSPNIDLLRQLYQQSPVAQAFFDHTAKRERDQSETKVDRILVLLSAEGHAFPRRDIISLFRKLQEQGCGQFVEGRRGWRNRLMGEKRSAGLRMPTAANRPTLELCLAGFRANYEKPSSPAQNCSCPYFSFSRGR
jgi:hypothetical protein